MAVVKDLIVLKVGELSPSQFDKPYRKIIFKSVDQADKTRYSLNLVQDKRDETNYSNWMKNLKEGAVLRVEMQEKYPKNVSQYRQFKIVNEEITQETIIDDMISMELEKITRYTNLIQKASEEIERLTVKKINSI